jgi:osmoprotectant transport system ATP-binding protein
MAEATEPHRIRDIQLHADAPVVDVNDDITTARQRLRDSDWTALLVVDAERRPQRWLRPTDLKRPSADLHQGGLPVDATVEPQATLADALNEMIISNAGCVVVTDGRGAYQGVADIDTIMASIRAMRAQVDEYYRAAKLLDIEGEVAV